MASNSFGNIFRITTWGESHGRAIGVVIDGCPAGLKLQESDINQALAKRAPGINKYTSPRKEKDIAEIYSGVFAGETTGAPISIIIPNVDADTSKYESIKNIIRPGHANYTYLKKYGVFDYRGGGRASARETACRVAAGAVAQKILDTKAIKTNAFIRSVGDCISTAELPEFDAEHNMHKLIESAMATGDSLGGVVEFKITNVVPGIGDPVYEKLEANLAKAMLSLPASKGFEFGSGFGAAAMQGSEHNDIFIGQDGQTATNNAGGTLGGIASGMPIYGRVAFKPTSSIKKAQVTIDESGNSTTLELPAGSRHDPCVAIRAVPVVNAMCQIVIADALLLDRCIRCK